MVLTMLKNASGTERKAIKKGIFMVNCMYFCFVLSLLVCFIMTKSTLQKKMSAMRVCVEV